MDCSRFRWGIQHCRKSVVSLFYESIWIPIPTIETLSSFWAVTLLRTYRPFQHTTFAPNCACWGILLPFIPTNWKNFLCLSFRLFVCSFFSLVFCSHLFLSVYLLDFWTFVDHTLRLQRRQWKLPKENLTANPSGDAAKNLAEDHARLQNPARHIVMENQALKRFAKCVSNSTALMPMRHFWVDSMTGKSRRLLVFLEGSGLCVLPRSFLLLLVRHLLLVAWHLLLSKLAQTCWPRWRSKKVSVCISKDAWDRGAPGTHHRTSNRTPWTTASMLNILVYYCLKIGGNRF